MPCVVEYYVTKSRLKYDRHKANCFANTFYYLHTIVNALLSRARIETESTVERAFHHVVNYQLSIKLEAVKATKKKIAFRREGNSFVAVILTVKVINARKVLRHTMTTVEGQLRQ